VSRFRRGRVVPCPRARVRYRVYRAKFVCGYLGACLSGDFHLSAKTVPSAVLEIPERRSCDILEERVP